MNAINLDPATLVWLQVWQIALLGLIVGGINLVIGRCWPHLAYALWLVVLAKCFLPPVGNWPVNILGRLTPAILLPDRSPVESVVSGAATNFEPPQQEAMGPDFRPEL